MEINKVRDLIIKDMIAQTLMDLKTKKMHQEPLILGIRKVKKEPIQRTRNLKGWKMLTAVKQTLAL